MPLPARQVRTWTIRYHVAGPGGLADATGRGCKSPRRRPGRVDSCRRVRALCGEDVRRIPGAEFGVVRSLPAVHHLPHVLGFEPRRPRPRRPEASAETRFGRKGIRTTVWAERGSRPTAPEPGAFGNVHVLTAVCPAAGPAEGLTAPALDAGVVRSLLDRLTVEGFVRRLRAGRVVNCVYYRGDPTGLISAWPHGGGFVLTWEECPAGRQYDESTDTRDERHAFVTAEEVLAFAETSGYPASAFTP